MRPKFWTPKLYRSFPQGTGKRNASLLLWFAVGVLLPWLVRSIGVARSDEQIGFETALERVAELAGEVSGDRAGSAASQYGIPQTTYDAWRHSQNQRLQNINRISQAEVRAIYQHYWQRGGCDRYEPPLDMVCLDSLVSFGATTGKQFLVDLPDDPKAAALEVARRRQAFRQQSATAPGSAQTLRQEMAHDRALVALIESYSSSEQAQFSSGLRRWLESRQPEASDPPSDSPGSGDAESPEENSQPDSTSPASDRIYQQAKPFVVEVWISTPGIIAPAAGVLLTSDGLVVTNYHVIDGADLDSVRSTDGEKFKGRVIKTDPDLDLALIQLQAANNLPTAKLANDSSQVKVGDTVYAIGSPMGEHWKMTQAEVIQVNSDCGLSRLQCLRTPEGFLKPGNSGGPLLDSSGQVIGINRAIQDGTGEGVSIPIETVKQFVKMDHR